MTWKLWRFETSVRHFYEGCSFDLFGECTCRVSKIAHSTLQRSHSISSAFDFLLTRHMVSTWYCGNLCDHLEIVVELSNEQVLWTFFLSSSNNGDDLHAHSINQCAYATPVSLRSFNYLQYGHATFLHLPNKLWSCHFPIPLVSLLDLDNYPTIYVNVLNLHHRNHDESKATMLTFMLVQSHALLFLFLFLSVDVSCTCQYRDHRANTREKNEQFSLQKSIMCLVYPLA